LIFSARTFASSNREIRSHAAVPEDSNTRHRSRAGIPDDRLFERTQRMTLREPEAVRASLIHERKCARRAAQGVYAEIMFSLA